MRHTIGYVRRESKQISGRKEGLKLGYTVKRLEKIEIMKDERK